jgi:large repetitive protein
MNNSIPAKGLRALLNLMSKRFTVRSISNSFYNVPSNTLGRINLVILGILCFGFSSFAANVDLSLRQSISNSTPSLNGQVVYTVYLKNSGPQTATNITVEDRTTIGSLGSIVGNVSSGSWSFNAGTGRGTWIVNSLAAGDSVSLTLTANAISRGVYFNIVEVISSADTDADSAPNNSLVYEDDIATTCFSIPLLWYPGDEYTVSVPAPYSYGSGIQWLYNGTPITSTSTVATVNPDSSLTIKAVGNYTFTTTVSTCPASGCCAIQIIQGPYGSIGDLVFEDTNLNGIKDPSESGIQNITVQLRDSSGVLLSQTITNALGEYKFDSLTDDYFSIRVVIPSGRILVPANTGTDDTVDSDVNSSTGISNLIQISTLETNGTVKDSLNQTRNNTTTDAGFIPNQGTIGDIVFYDNNNNGIRDLGESGVANVSVVLLNNLGVPVDTVITNFSGNYTFNTVPGTYSLRFLTSSLPFGFAYTTPNFGSDDTIDSDVDATGTTATFVLTGGATNNNMDAGIFHPATLGNLVWSDINQNGMQDGSEPGIPNVVVYLLNSVGAPLDTTITDATGNYTFNVSPGDYILEFARPTNYTLTSLGIGTEAVDNDANPATGRTDLITIASNVTNNDIDAGFYPTLFDLALTKTSATSSVVAGGNITYTLSLINQGNVNATNININDYIPTGLTLNDPAWTVSTPGIATRIAPITGLVAGSTRNISITFRVDSLAIGTISNAAEIGIAYDNTGALRTDFDSTPDNNPSNDGTPKDNEVSENHKLNPTDDEDDHDFGNITVTAVPTFDLALSATRNGTGPIYPGNLVSFTINVLNQGTQNATLVNLIDYIPAGLTLQDANWTLSGSNAVYNTPFSVPSGATVPVTISFLVNSSFTGGIIDNFVEISDARGPIGQVMTDLDSTPDLIATNDGTVKDDVINENGKTGGDEDDHDLAGITVTPYATIGNYVWNDTNGNGLQDSGENGLGGITIELQTPTGVVVATTTSTFSGLYTFTNVIPGNYVVSFELPSGFEGVPANVGSNDLIDSDVNILTGNTNVITLLPGENNTTTDAAFKLPTCPTITSLSTLDAQICVGDSTFLVATASNGSAINWYLTSINGTSIFTTNSGQNRLIFPTTTTTYYAEMATTSVGCPNVRQPAILIVNAFPANPSSIAAISYCAGETIDLDTTIINSITTPGGVFEWHTGPSEFSPLVANPNSVTQGSYYLFEKSGAGCYSNPTKVDVNLEVCLNPVDLSLVKTANNRNVTQNDLVTYTITLANAGLNNASNILIQDILPAGLTFVSSNDFNYNNDTLSLIVSNLAGGLSRQFTYVARATGLGSIVNSVQIVSANESDVDSTPGNALLVDEDDDDDETITVISATPIADLSIQKTSNTVIPNRGDNVTYTILVNNNGPSNATNVEITDILPAGLQYVSSSGGDAITVVDSTIRVTFNNLTAGDQDLFTIVARVTGTGVIVNNAQITNSDQSDPDSVPNGGLNEDDDDSRSISVQEVCNPNSPLISSLNTFICNGDTATISAFGCSTGTIVWSNGMTGNLIRVSPSVNTTYTAICRESATCSSASSNAVNITLNVLSAPSITADITTVCSGSTVVLSASGCSGIVNWSNGRTGNSISEIITGPSTYSARCSSGTCLSANSNSVSISINATPNAPLISSLSTTICAGDSVTLTASGCTSNVVWNNNEFIGTPYTTVLTANKTFTATCNAGSCSSALSNSISVIVTPTPTPVIVSTKDATCGAEQITLTVNNCSGIITWNGNPSLNTSSIMVTPNTTTTYAVSCRVGSCTGATTKTITVGIGGQSPTLVANNNTICAGESVTITASNCNGTLTWTPSGKTTSSITETPLVTTTYTAACNTGTSCIGYRDILITVVPKPSAPTVTAGKTNICIGESLTLTANNCTGTVNWSTGATGTTLVVSPLVSTNYTATCTENTCISNVSNAVNIVVNGTIPVISANRNSICGGSESVTLTATSCAGTVTWSNGKTGFSITETPLVTTTYSATCTVGTCVSPKSNDETIGVSSAINPPTVISAAQNVCPTLTANLNTQIRSSVSTTNGVFEFHTGILPTSPLVSNPNSVGAGTYYAFEKAATGCYSAGRPIVVTIQTCNAPVGSVDIAVNIEGDKSEVKVGDNIVYTITVTNNGPSIATHVDVVNTFPQGIEIVSMTPGLSLTDHVLSTTIGSMAVGQTITYTYTGKLTKVGINTNTVEVTRVDQTEILKQNNIDSFDVQCSTCQQTCISTALKADTVRMANGSYNIKFTSIIENCGNVKLDTIRLTDDMSAMFTAPSTFTIVQAPIVNAGSSLIPNINYNGTTDLELLRANSSSLIGAKIDTVTWIINLIPNGAVGPFSTNSIARGIGLTGFGFTQNVSDVSNDGSVINKPNAEPTVVRLYKSPSIGIALSIKDTIRNSNGTFIVNYRAIVKNNGALTLNNVIVTDTLSKAYSSPATFALNGSPILNPGSQLVLNPAFNGSSDTRLTLGTSRLGIGVADTICYSIVVNPDTLKEFITNAIASGTGTLAGGGTQTVRDISQSGINPDAVGSTPTKLTIVELPSPTACIGIALRISDTTRLANGSYDITYKAIIRNCGTLNLTNISICDTLANTFASPVVATLVGKPSLNANSTMKIDTSFNGVSNTCMLNSATSTLAAFKIDTLTWKVNVVFNSNYGPFRNNVTVSGLSPSATTITDISNDGTNPDPAGSNPTVVNFNIIPKASIGIAKELISAVKVAGETDKYDVNFGFVVKNYGIFDFDKVQVQDNLAETFGDLVTIDSVNIYDVETGFRANTNFTGKGLLIEMLDENNSTLAKGETRRFKLFARLDLSQTDSSKFYNVGFAIGKYGTLSTEDVSTQGVNPDVAGDGDPDNDGIPTLIDFGSRVQEIVTPLGIAKSVVASDQNSDGSYTLTYTVVVKNYGLDSLTNVQLKDSLDYVFGDSAQVVVTKKPTVNTSSRLKVNPDFNGVTDYNLFLADSSSLAVGKSDTLTFVLKVSNDSDTTAIYNNLIYGTADAGLVEVTDVSTNGLNPDPDGDNNPGDNSVPTPVELKHAQGSSVIIIESGFSPDNSGLNDIWSIRGIRENDNVSVFIYNRWGGLVYETANYRRDFPDENTQGWNGIANRGFQVGKAEGVPDGTYYYKIQSSNVNINEAKPIIGFITLKRK